MKKSVLLALACALPVIAIAGPDLTGTYKIAPELAKPAGRRAPVAVIIVEHQGDKLSLKENSADGYLITGFDCTIGASCDNTAARSETKFPGKARWEGNDLVLTSEHTGQSVVMRRYVLSADRKTLTSMAKDAKTVEAEFFRD